MPAGSLHFRNAQYGFFQQILISDNYLLLMTNINKITDNFTYLHWSFSFFLLYFLSLKKNLVLYYCPPLLLKYTMCHYGQLSAEVMTTKDIYVYEDVREHNIYSVEALSYYIVVTAVVSGRAILGAAGAASALCSAALCQSRKQTVPPPPPIPASCPQPDPEETMTHTLINTHTFPYKQACKFSRGV